MYWAMCWAVGLKESERDTISALVELIHILEDSYESGKYNIAWRLLWEPSGRVSISVLRGVVGSTQ